MAESGLVRTGGLLVPGGAVAYVVHLVARSLLTAGMNPVASAQTGPWAPVNALGALGAAFVLLGLQAVAVSLAGRVGMLALVGFGLIAASWMFLGLFLSLYGALVLPWLAEQAPRLVDGSTPTPSAFVAAFALALLAWLAGALLVAVPFLKGQAQPRWVGWLLPASALWAVAGTFVVAPDGPASNLAVNLLSNLGPALLLIALGRLGYQAWTERPESGATPEGR